MRLNNGAAPRASTTASRSAAASHCKDEAFWKRHIQADGMVTMWIFVGVMGMGMPAAPLLVMLDWWRG